MRDRRIDFMKGMLMWCVVYGHTINALLSGTAHAPIWLHTFVRTFDLPFFMILSGYYLKKSLDRRAALQVVSNRASMILAPIIVWTLVLGRVDFWHRYYFLWAVFCCGIICSAGHVLNFWLHNWIGVILECLLYLVAIVLLHVLRVPWNLFYLFPFFIVGYYLQGLYFDDKRWFWIVLVVFAAGLCFWSEAYTPWGTGALAWKVNNIACWIYVYRFVLGISGVFIMGTIFDAAYRLFGENALFMRLVVRMGSETLALYILQTIFIEFALRSFCVKVFSGCLAVASQSIFNLIGYCIAPILSFAACLLLHVVAICLKRFVVTRYLFGFRVKQ